MHTREHNDTYTQKRTMKQSKRQLDTHTSKNNKKRTLFASLLVIVFVNVSIIVRYCGFVIVFHLVCAIVCFSFCVFLFVS